MKSVGAVAAIILDYLREKLLDEGIQYQTEFSLEEKACVLTWIDQQTAPVISRIFAATGLSMTEVWPRSGMVLGLTTVKMNDSRAKSYKRIMSDIKDRERIYLLFSALFYEARNTMMSNQPITGQHSGTDVELTNESHGPNNFVLTSVERSLLLFFCNKSYALLSR